VAIRLGAISETGRRKNIAALTGASVFPRNNRERDEVRTCRKGFQELPDRSMTSLIQSKIEQRRRLRSARLEVSAAYLGREARMRVIGIAVFAVFFLGIVYAAFDLRRDHNQINRIREECRTQSDAGKVKECNVDSALRDAQQPKLP
jgi:hypothetical protein